VVKKTYLAAALHSCILLKIILHGMWSGRLYANES